MRGICFFYHHVSLFSRFNPAYAGNIKLMLEKRMQTKVQPRVCGEYYVLDADYGMVAGSTPRMRGILTQSQILKFLTGSTPRMRGISMCNMPKIVADRFNPAYAGNIGTHGVLRCGSEVQPRVCGEYLFSENIVFPFLGSTPRMRGILSIF